MSFTKAMDKEMNKSAFINIPKKIFNNKGDISYSINGLSSKLENGQICGLWNKMIQDSSKLMFIENYKLVKNKIKEYLSNSYTKHLGIELIVYLMVIWAETRDCRGNLAGKGWKDGSHWIFIELLKDYPKTMLNLLPLYSEYGCWKDYQKLYEMIDNCNNYPEALNIKEIFDLTKSTIIKLWAERLKIDYEYLKQEQINKISLCAKFIPKEKKSLDKKCNVYKKIAKLLFKNKTCKKDLRMLCSKLNKAIDTTEIKMCENKYSKINPNKIPSRCLFKNRKAFAYEMRGKLNKGKLRGNDPDRLEGRKNYLDFLESGKRIKGTQMYIHEIVNVIRKKQYSEIESKLFDGQWKDHVNKLLTEIKEQDLNMGNMVICADVSGSMTCDNGRPMNCSVSFGLMIAEIMGKLNPDFGNRFISFDEKPKWIEVDPKLPITNRVIQASNSPWGGSTDIIKCFEMIMKVGIENNLTRDKMPDTFLIVSDMQFDSALLNIYKNTYSIFKSLGGKVENYFRKIQNYISEYTVEDFKTTHEIIVEAFKLAGIQACGEPWDVPTMIYWNVVGDTMSFPTTIDTPNTIMISGYNIHTMKLILKGQKDKLEEIKKNYTLEKKQGVNTWDIFITAMTDPRYQMVYDTIEKTQEGVFKGYKAPILKIDSQIENDLDSEESNITVISDSFTSSSDILTNSSDSFEFKTSPEPSDLFSRIKSFFQ